MARKLRLQYPGGIYHVLNHGDRRKAIFCDEEDSPIKLIQFGLRYSDFLSPRCRAVAAGRISAFRGSASDLQVQSTSLPSLLL